MQMVSLQDSHCHSNSNQFPLIRTGQCGQSSCSSTKICRNIGRSMRTIRSNFYRTETDNSFCLYTTANDDVSNVSENVTDSAIDMRLGELVNVTVKSVKSSSSDDEFLEISQAFSDFSSDISGELQRLACVPNNETKNDDGLVEQENEPCLGFLERESFSAKIIDSISPEDLVPTVKICIDGLQSPSIAVRRSAASKLRLLAKNRADNRALIGESGAIPVLIPLLRCNDPWTQEHAVTALLNLSLHEENKSLIANEGAIKSLVYVLKTGTETSKQNAACALLNLALIEENKSSIGGCGAIPPLVSLLISGSNRGKKDALTSLYKLCSIRQNKERAVSAGAVKPLVEMVGENAVGTAEKAMVILSSLAAIDEGKEAIVQEGGIVALVEAIEDSSVKGKEFAVLTLLQLCCENVRNRGLLVREGAIPPLVALSQTGSARTKHKAERLLGYLREPRQEGSSPSPRSEVV